MYTFILIDAFCFIWSLLWDLGGPAERLDSSPAAGRDPMRFKDISVEQMFAETLGLLVAA